MARRFEAFLPFANVVKASEEDLIVAYGQHNVDELSAIGTTPVPPWWSSHTAPTVRPDTCAGIRRPLSPGARSR